MKRSNLRNASTILSTLLLGVLTACSAEESTSPAVGQTVRFAFNGYPQDTLRVLVRHGPTLEAVRAYLETNTGPRMPIGPIVRGAGSDPRYPFHFLPDSVRLADVAIELCDGAPMRTAAAVDAFIAGATGSVTSARATWCPWGAYPVGIEP